MSALGDQIWSTISAPTLTNIMAFHPARLAYRFDGLLHWRRRSTFPRREGENDGAVAHGRTLAIATQFGVNPPTVKRISGGLAAPT
jgi:hypothetical protein